MGAWEDLERETARRAAAEAERIAAEQREAYDQKAAEALVKGELAPEPPKPIARVEPNARRQPHRSSGATGRTASVRIKKVVTAIDLQKAWERFAAQPEVYNLFMELAQKAVDAGLTVPGATIEERSDIR